MPIFKSLILSKPGEIIFTCSRTNQSELKDLYSTHSGKTAHTAAYHVFFKTYIKWYNDNNYINKYIYTYIYIHTSAHTIQRQHSWNEVNFLLQGAPFDVPGVWLSATTRGHHNSRTVCVWQLQHKVDHAEHISNLCSKWNSLLSKICLKQTLHFVLLVNAFPALKTLPSWQDKFTPCYMLHNQKYSQKKLQYI